MTINTPDPLCCTAFVFGAFVLAGLAQSFWLRSKVSRAWAIPLDGGRRFRGRRVLGENKTLRGFVVMVPACGAAFLLMHGILDRLPLDDGCLWRISATSYFLLGCWSGMGFMLGELPNSFVKRQLGISAGQPPSRPWAGSVCFVVDQIDSVLGGLLALALVVPVPWVSWIVILSLGCLLHWLFNVLLMIMGLKARAA